MMNTKTKDKDDEDDKDIQRLEDQSFYLVYLPLKVPHQHSDNYLLLLMRLTWLEE